MLSTLMEKKLKKLRDRKLIVVMEDGEAFLGKLKEFDNDTIVLTEVYEGPSSEINWSDLKDNIDDVDRNNEVHGFVNWVSVNLEQVFLRVDHISRIWPWILTEDTIEKEKAPDRAPLYTRTPALELLAKENDKEVEED